MTTYMDMYNKLPTVEEANSRFTQRDAVFSKLAPLLSNYNNQFGVCLVHAHCIPHPGEKMIATGNISQPEDVANTSISYFPERWLANGKPFEFTKEPTIPPPPELFAAFSKIVGDIDILGLYFAGETSGEKRMEWTEGRQNITKVIAGTEGEGSIETAWLPGSVDPVQLYCNSVCSVDGLWGIHGRGHKSYD